MAITQIKLEELAEVVETHSNAKIKTWHQGKYGLWRWSDLTLKEQLAHKQSERRAAYVQEFNPCGLA